VPNFNYALVELYTDLPQEAYEEVGGAIIGAILANPDARSAAVRELVDRLADVACPRILFPGWTLVGTTLPQWLTERTGGRTFVVEMLPPEAQDERASALDRRPRAFVVRNQEVHVGPVFQLFWDRDGAGDIGAPSQAAVDLTTQLLGQQDPDRRWADDAGDAGLIVCGEVNVIYTPNDERSIGPLVAGFPSFDLIMNPAHKPNWLPRMITKRRYLSRMRQNAVLLMTANTHGRWLQWKRGKPQRGRARNNAAEAYRGGEKLAARESIEVGRHRILLFD